MSHYMTHVSTAKGILETIVLHIEDHDRPRPPLPEIKFTEELIDQNAPLPFVGIFTSRVLTFFQYRVRSLLHAA